MSFADPEDSTEESPPNREGDTESSTSPDETVELDWAAEREVIPDTPMPLDEAIKANAEVLRGKVDQAAFERLVKDVETLQEEVTGLRKRRNDLHAEIDTLTDRIETLEKWREDTVRTVNQNIADINRLATAVFANEAPCPECNDGRLAANIGGWGNDTVECSECDYEEELRKR